MDQGAARGASQLSFSQLRDVWAALQHAPVAIAIWRGPDHTFVLANAAFHGLFGCDDLIGKPLRSAGFESVSTSAGGPDSDLVSACDGVLGSGQPFYARTYALRASVGKPDAGALVSLSLTPVRDEENRVWGVAALAISGAERHSDAETNEVLVRVAQAISDLHVETIVQRVTDEATRVCRAEFGAFFYNLRDARGESYTLYSLSGVSREAFAKFPMPRNTLVFGPTFRGEGVVRIADVLADPRYGKNAPYHGMPEGHLPVRSYLAVPVVSRMGEVLGGLFFGHSATDVFTAHDEHTVNAIAQQAAVAIDNARLLELAQRDRATAEAASRAKDEFLATISHELRTPLNAILGWTNLLRAGTLSAEKSVNALEVIERNAKAQAALIADVLDVSRIVSGQLRLNISTLHIGEVVNAAIESIRPAADAKSIRLQVVVDLDAGSVAGDPNRLQQVAWNLLSNAVKFTHKGGRVYVRVERRDSFVQIVVADTGRGIAPEFLPHVFERFRQADATSTRSVGGLGLGLAIVKHLVELHGGTVRRRARASSEGPRSPCRSPSPPCGPARSSCPGRRG